MNSGLNGDWRAFHAELMEKADAAKVGPEAVFSLFAVYESFAPADRKAINGALYLEILSEDPGIAFDAQAIACHFSIGELLPAIEERVRRLSAADSPSACAELLTSLNFVEMLRGSTSSAD